MYFASRFLFSLLRITRVLPAVAQSQHFVLARLQLQNILRIFGKILCRLQATQRRLYNITRNNRICHETNHRTLHR